MLVTGLRALLVPIGLLAPPDVGTGPGAEPTGSAQPGAETDLPEPEPEGPELAEPETPETPGTEVPKAVVPTGGSLAGSTIDPDDPNRGRAESDLEGESLDRTNKDLPDRLPRLQQAGWWMTFGSVSLGLAGGVFAGLAERQEDELGRLTFGVDLTTGARFRYGDYADTYESMVARGTSQMWVSRGLLVASGLALAGAITFFALDGNKRRNRKSDRVRFGAASAEVSF